MQKSKKTIAKIILAIMVIFAISIPMSGMAFATEADVVVDTILSADVEADLTAPAAEGEGPLADAMMPSIEEEIAVEEEAEEETNKYANTFWALVPPVIAIALALITKEVYSSLLIGIIFGALLSTSFNLIGAIDNVVNQGFIPAVADTAGIFIFLVLLGVVVALANKCGEIGRAHV